MVKFENFDRTLRKILAGISGSERGIEEKTQEKMLKVKEKTYIQPESDDMISTAISLEKIEGEDNFKLSVHETDHVFLEAINDELNSEDMDIGIKIINENQPDCDAGVLDNEELIYYINCSKSKRVTESELQDETRIKKIIEDLDKQAKKDINNAQGAFIP